MNFEKLEYDLIEGKAGNKVLFQPRIICWYDDKKFLKEPLPGDLEGCDIVEVYRKLGVSNRIYDYTMCFDVLTDKSIKSNVKKLNAQETLYSYDTPVGSIHMVTRNNESNPGVYYKKWLLETNDDIRVKKYINEASDFKFNRETFDKLYSVWGEIGAPTMFICRTPLQDCFVETMGVENTVYALLDEREMMEDFFESKEQLNLRLIREINVSPIRIINYGDNIHCGLTAPEFFERYIIPVYQRRYPLLHGAGKFVHSHWDGDVKSILRYAKSSCLDGIEAITPKPQGDVTLEEVRDALGDKIFLLDGIAALLFNDSYPEEQLVAQVHRLIDYFKGRLILGISDEMPSRGNIGRVRLVRDIVAKHNASC